MPLLVSSQSCDLSITTAQIYSDPGCEEILQIYLLTEWLKQAKNIEESNLYMNFNRPYAASSKTMPDPTVWQIHQHNVCHTSLYQEAHPSSKLCHQVVEQSSQQLGRGTKQNVLSLNYWSASDMGNELNINSI